MNRQDASQFGITNLHMDYNDEAHYISDVDYLFLSEQNIISSLKAMTDLLAFFRANQASFPEFMQRVRGHVLSTKLFSPNMEQQISTAVSNTTFAELVELLEVGLQTGFLVALKFLKLLDYYQNEAEQ